MPHNEVVEHTNPTALQAREAEDKCVIFSSKQSHFQDSTDDPKVLILLEAYVSSISYHETGKAICSIIEHLKQKE